MGTDGQTRWIVIIDKIPRGPLTEAEVLTLLQEGIVKVNDIAFRVAAEKSESEWKFLWQFSEFDRRSAERTAGTDGEASYKEKRAPKDPDQAQKEALALLPQELASIKPEDLIIRAHPRTPEIDDIHPEKEGSSEDSAAPRFKATGWVNFGLAFVFLGFVVYQIIGGDDEQKFESRPQRDVSQIITRKPEPRTTMPLPLNEKPNRAPAQSQSNKPVKPSAPAALPAAPSGKDSGDIPLDEYMKRREERWAKERQEEEERLKAEQKAEEELEKEAFRGEEKKKTKKRKAASEDDEPGEQEEVSAEESEEPKENTD
jgi:hypothetical protein